MFSLKPLFKCTLKERRSHMQFPTQIHTLQINRAWLSKFNLFCNLTDRLWSSHQVITLKHALHVRYKKKYKLELTRPFK